MYRNRINHMRYIGQTRRNIGARDREHHNPNSCMDIDIAVNEHPENFELTIIGWYPVKELDYWEEYWIDYWDTYRGYGYNRTPGGNSGSSEALMKKVVMRLSDSQEITIANSVSEAASILKEKTHCKSGVATLIPVISDICTGRPRYSDSRASRFKTKCSRKSSHGYYFTFLEDYESDPEKFLSMGKCSHSRKPKPIYAVNLETNEEYWFRSMTAAADWLVDTEYNWKGLCSESIRCGILNVIRYSGKQCCGFTFYEA